VAVRGARVIGHQGDMFWRAHLADGRRTIVTYDNWKATEPDPGDYEPFGECHWCGYRAQLYRMWLLTGVEGWFCSDCAEELETESRIKHRPVVRSISPRTRLPERAEN
jgi:hypothetical protein